MNAQATVPPVIRSVTVAVPVERAFEVFTRRIADWWPLHTHGVFGEDAAGLRLDSERLVERSRDGEEAVWGEVLAWEPPTRLVLTWHPGAGDDEPMTEIEVSFRAQGAATTVVLEHRGWEALGERGAEVRGGYNSGWGTVLDLYASAAA